MSTRLERLSGDGPPPAATVAYGPDPDQVYDVRLPEHPRGVTLVLLHGGFWRPSYDRQHASAQAVSLGDSGFHVAVVEYRRAARGGWPAMRSDLLDALCAIRGDSRLPDPWLTMGHSAGGHLALWLQHQEVATDLLGAVALAPCAHLRRTYELGLDDDAAVALMGATPTEAPHAWQDADPSLLGRPTTPVRLVHGDQDSRVPSQLSDAYLEAVGLDRDDLDLVPGAGHFDLIDPQSPHFARTLRAAEALASRA